MHYAKLCGGGKEILTLILADSGNLFVISSDFCHWGSRFGFVYHDKRAGPIHKCIEWLDRTGMALIEGMDPTK
jgi:MEMO1 family protein